jgi:Holliday junction resolvasome RuvABC endonuclease subunit
LPEKTFDGGLTPGKPVAIGIDQSLTGFAMCAVEIADPTHYEAWVFTSPYRGVQRLDDIAHFIAGKMNLLEDNSNDVYDIAMEGTVLQSHAASVLGELAGVVKLVLFSLFEDATNELLKTPLQVPPMTLKKFVSGKGTATKDMMLLNVYKRYGVELTDNNAADAYGLARIASEFVIDDVEKGIIKKLNDPKFRDSIQD